MREAIRTYDANSRDIIPVGNVAPAVGEKAPAQVETRDLQGLQKYAGELGIKKDKLGGVLKASDFTGFKVEKWDEMKAAILLYASVQGFEAKGQEKQKERPLADQSSDLARGRFIPPSCAIKITISPNRWYRSETG